MGRGRDTRPEARDAKHPALQGTAPDNKDLSYVGQNVNSAKAETPVGVSSSMCHSNGVLVKSVASNLLGCEYWLPRLLAA